MNIGVQLHRVESISGNTIPTASQLDYTYIVHHLKSKTEVCSHVVKKQRSNNHGSRQQQLRMALCVPGTTADM